MAEEISTQNAVVTGGTPATTSPRSRRLTYAGCRRGNDRQRGRDRYWRCRSRQFYRS